MSCTPGPGRMFVMSCDCQSFSFVLLLLWDCMYSCYYYEFHHCCLRLLQKVINSGHVLIASQWWTSLGCRRREHSGLSPLEPFPPYHPFLSGERQILRRGSSDSANWPLWEAGEEVGRSWRRSSYTPLRKQNSNNENQGTPQKIAGLGTMIFLFKMGIFRFHGWFQMRKVLSICECVW